MFVKERTKLDLGLDLGLHLQPVQDELAHARASSLDFAEACLAQAQQQIGMQSAGSVAVNPRPMLAIAAAAGALVLGAIALQVLPKFSPQAVQPAQPEVVTASAPPTAPAEAQPAAYQVVCKDVLMPFKGRVNP